jgi:hypothetical protein
VVGHRDGLLAELGRPLHEPVDAAGAIEQAVIGVEVEVDEIGGGAGHAEHRTARENAPQEERGGAAESGRGREVALVAKGRGRLRRCRFLRNQHG